MLGYILFGVGFIVYGGAIWFTMTTLFDSSMFEKTWWIGIVMLAAIIAFSAWFLDEVTKNSPPCAQYETQMMYNAATKTMMPAQFCAKEGTWVNQ